MPLTQAELARVRWQLALEESERKKAAEQSKPSFLRWLGSVGLAFIADKIFTLVWTTIKLAFGLPF
jgi:hypothetical protein